MSSLILPNVETSAPEIHRREALREPCAVVSSRAGPAAVASSLDRSIFVHSRDEGHCKTGPWETHSTLRPVLWRFRVFPDIHTGAVCRE